ncbi:MBL fold metallo-hydrolase [Caloranaerobacter azorensis]|uniref:MBL fold metallo-hydrolase n=1 Tax=Caloranaerobacter azorensis TaxID=116090 RepID=A0A6P1YA67_9FIRM|nr:MBL fold metallo-hydrolase [Caloranaerobacter azorensis]QIB26071.1 MBL fold metallo-hydrolase [Caloranaerobacter azorensis]
MKLKILGSSSSGNCYLLQNKTETLVLECGVKWNEVKKALNFNMTNICGCLITHEHKDHCKYIKDVLKAGIDIYSTKGTLKALKIDSHRSHVIEYLKPFKVGGYSILPFQTKHDCEEPVGFLIQHEDMGTLLFATDTYYLEYKFENLNHILVECNYSLDILNKNIEAGKIHPAFKNRVLQSHFEFDNVKNFLKANNLAQVANIVLLHLSNDNSDSARFKTEIEKLTGKLVHIADKGLEIDIGLYPF